MLIFVVLSIGKRMKDSKRKHNFQRTSRLCKCGMNGFSLGSSVDFIIELMSWW